MPGRKMHAELWGVVTLDNVQNLTGAVLGKYLAEKWSDVKIRPLFEGE